MLSNGEVAEQTRYLARPQAVSSDPEVRPPPAFHPPALFSTPPPRFFRTRHLEAMSLVNSRHKCSDFRCLGSFSAWVILQEEENSLWAEEQLRPFHKREHKQGVVCVHALAAQLQTHTRCPTSEEGLRSRWEGTDGRHKTSTRKTRSLLPSEVQTQPASDNTNIIDFMCVTGKGEGLRRTDLGVTE